MTRKTYCGNLLWQSSLTLLVRGLEKVGTARQMDLFAPPKVSEASPLYKAIDAINARYGKGKVFSASEGIGDKSWKMKRSKLSKRASTRWDELLVVR